MTVQGRRSLMRKGVHLRTQYFGHYVMNTYIQSFAHWSFFVLCYSFFTQFLTASVVPEFYLKVFGDDYVGHQI